MGKRKEMKAKETNVKIVTVAIFIATFMTAIEGTIVSTAMPTIIGSLHGLSIMNWVFSIYLLTNAMMTPIYGKLADKIGRKKIFIIGILIFIIGSSMCGLSQNMLHLIVSRAIQGVGAGAIMPVALTIIADIYPVNKRAKVLGFNNAAWGIASVFGPLFGGFIVDTLSWHWIFLINVPIGIILIFLISHYFVEPKREVKTKEPVDFLGSGLLMATLMLLLYGFQTIADSGSMSLASSLYLFLAVVLFIWFILVEKQAKDPVISLQLFQNPTFVVVNIVAALVSGFLIGIEVYMPMWMQGVLGLNAAMGGIVLAPMSITWIGGSFLGGKLMESLDTKKVLGIGIGFILIGGMCLWLVPASTSYSVFLMISVILGIGLGVTITTTTVKAQNSVAHEVLGVATSFNTLARTLGQTLMVSIFGVIFNQTLAAEMMSRSQQGVSQELLNKLVNPHTANEIPADLLEPLKGLLYTALHTVYFCGLLLLIVAFLFNFLQKDRRKQN